MKPSVLRVLSSLSHLSAFEVLANYNEMDVKGWLANGRYTPIASTTGITLQPLIPPEYSAAIANDIQKNGYAFIETILNLKSAPNANRTAPWIAVKMYYAAFFGAHTVLRVFGQTCSFLDSNVIQLCNREIAKHLGESATTLKRGLHFTNLVQADRLSVTQLKDSHKDTWRTLSKLLDDLADKSKASNFASEDRNDTIAYLSSLQSKLQLLATDENRAIAMSELRNKINYQYSHGVWYPSVRAANEFITRADDGIRSLGTSSVADWAPRDELDAFVSATVHLSEFLIEILKINVDRANTQNTKMTKLKARVLQVL